jgi:predicted secreted protein
LFQILVIHPPMVPMRRMHTLNLPVGGHNVALGGASISTVPAPVAAARELFATMDGNTATIKAALVMGAAQVQGGSLVLDKATVIAEGGAKRKWLVEQGREWPSREFGGLIIAVADADAAYQNTIL